MWRAGSDLDCVSVAIQYLRGSAGGPGASAAR